MYVVPSAVKFPMHRKTGIIVSEIDGLLKVLLRNLGLLPRAMES